MNTKYPAVLFKKTMKYYIAYIQNSLGDFCPERIIAQSIDEAIQRFDSRGIYVEEEWVEEVDYYTFYTRKPQNW